MAFARLSLDEYLIGPETNHPQELVYGVVREPAAPTWGHQIIVGRVFVRLDRHVARYGLGQVIQSPVDVVLDRERALVVQPDVVFVTHDRLRAFGDRVLGPPDLAVEVLSMGTARRDSTLKLSWFRRYGVQECWLVDPVECRVIVHCADGSSAVFSGDQRLRSTVLPRLRLCVPDLFES